MIAEMVVRVMDPNHTFFVFWNDLETVLIQIVVVYAKLYEILEKKMDPLNKK